MKNSSIVELNIFHQNVCGLQNKKSELELYLSCLPVEQTYVGFSEHFLSCNTLPLFNLSNYLMSSYCYRDNKSRGGTLILSVTGRQCEDILFCKSLFETDIFEVCGTRDTQTDLCICCFYRIPSDKLFGKFIVKLEKLLDYFFNKKTIIVGDFNVNLLLNNQYKQEFLALLTSYNFRPLIDAVTYIRNESQSCIDNFLTNLPDENIIKIDVDHNNLADGHAGIFCTVQMEKSKGKNGNEQVMYREQRIFNKKSKQAFREQLMQLNWNDMSINVFLSKLSETFQNCFKLVTKKVNIKRDTRLKWATKGVRIASKMKRFLSTCSASNCNATILKYKTSYVRIFRRVIRNLKRNAVQHEIEKSSNSSKAIWSVINRHRNKGVLKIKQKLKLKTNNLITADPLKIVNVFSENFDHGKDLVNSDTKVASDLLVSNTKRIEHDIIFRDVNDIEVTKLVQKMPNKKSSGYDEIPIEIIKENLDILALPLATFFNNCVEIGLFPEQLKIAKIIPTFKKGDRTDPKKYRPISLLTIVSKIFEKIIKSRLLLHLNSNDVLSRCQFGYTKGIGTTDAADQLIDDVVQNLNDRKKVAGLFLDLSSAFDTVDHDILLNKLEYYGVRANILLLLRSYLHNRIQFVEIKENVDGVEKSFRSKMVKITRGVPQGSILGPILFILFTDDLINFIINLIPDIKLVIYADDTNAILSSNTLNDLQVQVNTALSAFNSWFTCNNLKLNTSKTNVMLFKSTVRNNETLDVSVDGNKVVTVSEVKFLGIHIDSLLNWKLELNSIECTISSACFALRSLRDDITIKQLRTVYFALVESRLRYSIKLWGNSYDYNSQKAFVCQKRAIRTIVRIPQWESCREHFVALDILTVPCLYIFVLLTDLAKNLHKFEDVNNKLARNASRRKEIKNFHPVPILEIAKHTSRYQSIVLYNKLPVELKLIDNQANFKNKLKSFLLKKCYYSIDEYLSRS